MLNLLFIGDPHFRGTNPRNRKDDYREAFKAKMREVFGIAKEYDCKAIITPGDFLDTVTVADSVKLELATLLNESPCPIYTTIGNHEIDGYNLDTYDRSSLKVLEVMYEKLKVYTDEEPVDFQNPNVRVHFTPYSGKMDVNGFGYMAECGRENGITVQVSHGMALDHVPPFDRYSLIQEIKTDADLILTGHDHSGYGVYKRADGKVFCNPGSLTRTSASVSEMERKVQVALITFDDNAFGVTLIPLKSAKPGEEVLDRTQIELEEKRSYSMDTFKTLIKTGTGQKVSLDINQAIEQIAKKQLLAPDVVKKALEKIDYCKSLIGG